MLFGGVPTSAVHTRLRARSHPHLSPGSGCTPDPKVCAWSRTHTQPQIPPFPPNTRFCRPWHASNLGPWQKEGAWLAGTRTCAATVWDVGLLSSCAVHEPPGEAGDSCRQAGLFLLASLGHVVRDSSGSQPPSGTARPAGPRPAVHTDRRPQARRLLEGPRWPERAPGPEVQHPPPPLAS
ncbi:hypothetical protein NN561_000436 [Cricetulus griseus]